MVDIRSLRDWKFLLTHTPHSVGFLWWNLSHFVTIVVSLRQDLHTLHFACQFEMIIGGIGMYNNTLTIMHNI